MAGVAGPLVPDGEDPVRVSGIVERVEPRPKDHRYTLRVTSLQGLAQEQLPEKVRIVWRGEPPGLRPGDRARFFAKLGPPPGPALPGGYDFGQAMAFERIGGTGFALAQPVLLAPGKGGWGHDIERLRIAVAERAGARIGGTAGPVAAALLTGHRQKIDTAVVEDLRDAGLAHLLAISGLHMGLVCGLLFWITRKALLLDHRAALNLPVKKIAAVTGLLGGAVYLALSGAAWSAQRAFIMAAVLFVAILFDRRGLSLRNAALAAIIILAMRPEAVISAGFQMSFAAVVALIAAFGWWEERRAGHTPRSFPRKAIGFVVGLAATSIIAGFATAPFSIHHFGQFANYGLVGNLLAMPLVTMLVMPSLVAALVLMPFGLDGPFLDLAGWGIGRVIAIAGWTAELEGAVRLFPALDPAGLVAAVIGLLLLCLLRSPLRLAGAGVLLLAVPLSAPAAKPDLFTSRDLRNIGILTDDPERPLLLLSNRRERFVVESWLQALGSGSEMAALPMLRGCRPGPCTAGLNGGRRLIIHEREDGIEESCRSADVVILRSVPTPRVRELCADRLIALDGDGRAAPASLTFEDGRPVVRYAAGRLANSM